MHELMIPYPVVTTLLPLTSPTLLILHRRRRRLLHAPHHLHSSQPQDLQDNMTLTNMLGEQLHITQKLTEE